MIATYASALFVCAVSLIVGQAVLALCGVRRWSWVSPAVGLAVLTAISWGAVNLFGASPASTILITALVAISYLCMRRGVEGLREAASLGVPVLAAALAAGSLPFLVEGHFGILGTGFNPDMSQHLLATDRLIDGSDSDLVTQGYPVGPHAIVAILDARFAVGVVHGFDGVTLAALALAALTALAALGDRPPLERACAALVIGIPYLVASYYAQGAFKETIQALFVLAFALTLLEATRDREWRELPLRFVPAAVIAAGSVYAYSFAGLVWPAGIAVVWLLVELARGRRAPWGQLGIGLAVLALGVVPELGRMLDFRRFETFDPSGPGLGNLFGQVSPLTALGIWPSGDFRLAAGDGAVPAIAFYLGAAFAAALLVAAIAGLLRRRGSVILAALATVAAVYLAARIDGTPYQAAKALEVAAPIVALAIAAAPWASGERRLSKPMARKSAWRPAIAPLLWAYLAAAGACSLLALANAPVGPTAYSPELTGLRPTLAGAPTLFLASDRLLDEEHGERYVVWELRGGRVCVEPESSAGGSLPAGIEFVVTEGETVEAPFTGLELERRAGPYTLWRRSGPVRGPSPCPLIEVRQARRAA